MPVVSAVALPSDRTYLFLDDSTYNVVDGTTGMTIETGRPLLEWPGLPSPPDAALYWGFNKIYFFVGNNYLRYDTVDDRVEDGYPQPLSNWPGVWTDRVDAAVNWGSGKCYFFRDAEYLRYDMVFDR